MFGLILYYILLYYKIKNNIIINHEISLNESMFIAITMLLMFPDIT